MANKHETLTSLFTDIADAIKEKTGGNTLTWDGNTEGLVSVLVYTDANTFIYFVKVSDAVPPKDVFSNGVTTINSVEGVTNPSISSGDDGFIVAGDFVVIPSNNYEADGFVFPESGTYFSYIDYYDDLEIVDIVDSYTSSLTIPNYTGFASPIVADNFPDAIMAIESTNELPQAEEVSF